MEYLHAVIEGALWVGMVALIYWLVLWIGDNL